MSRPHVFLAAMGDVNDPRTFSGTPYHFLQAAQAVGLIDEGLKLNTEGSAWQSRRMLWNGWRYLTGRGKGGFQYSMSCLEQLWKPVRDRLRDQMVINCYQLFPPSIVVERRIRKVFYIDMTLEQLFDFYHQRDSIGPAIAREAVEREKEGYQSAELVVCHSQWAARSVVQDYGIEPEKVKAIVPGANIDQPALQRWNSQASFPDRPPELPLRLIFIGKYWDRKGLDRLLEALLLTQRQGRVIELTVLGCRREDLPSHLQDVAQVKWLGFLDKRSELQRFMQIVSEADVGCLLSRAEAGGMALREYHALGLAVLGTAVGGSPEHMFGDAGYAVSPEAPADEIARWLIELTDHPDKLIALRRRAWDHRQEASWESSVNQWRSLLS